MRDPAATQRHQELGRLIRRAEVAKWTRRILLVLGWMAFAAALAARDASWSLVPVGLGLASFAGSFIAALSLKRLIPRANELAILVTQDTQVLLTEQRRQQEGASAAQRARQTALVARPPVVEEVQAVAVVIEGADEPLPGQSGFRDDAGKTAHGFVLASHRFEGQPPKAIRLDLAKVRKGFAQAREAGVAEPRLRVAQGWTDGR